jgi:hypothetical protein
MRAMALSVLVLIALAAVPAPAGNGGNGCGLPASSDVNLQRLDGIQSAGAAKICALYLNNFDARSAP